MESELDQILGKYTTTTKEDGSLLGVSFQVRGKGGVKPAPATQTYNAD